MIRRLIVLCLVIFTFSVSAKVYRIVDEEGNVTYTDQPPADAVTDNVELPPVNQLPATKVERKSEDLPTKERGDTFQGYSVFEVVSPENDSTVLSDRPVIQIQLRLEPGLFAGHRIQYLFDGKPYGNSVRSTSFTIAELERGQHSVSARVIDENGAVVGTAPPSVVHVKRNFIRR